MDNQPFAKRSRMDTSMFSGGHGMDNMSNFSSASSSFGMGSGTGNLSNNNLTSASILTVSDVPFGCSEKDLSLLFQRYGEVRGVQLNGATRQALIQFGDAPTVMQLVTMAQSMPFYVGQSVVTLGCYATPTSMSSGNLMQQQINASSSGDGFSNNSSNMTAGNNMNSGMTTNAANSVQGGGLVTSQLLQQQQQMQQQHQSVPQQVLHLQISNVNYPITVDVLNTICSPSGKLSRICIGKKQPDNTIEALVEFQAAKDAAAAMEALNGADIYSGCCTLAINFSKVQKVHVTKNDTESWDYTNPNVGKTLLNVSGILGNNPVKSDPSSFGLMGTMPGSNKMAGQQGSTFGLMNKGSISGLSSGASQIGLFNQLQSNSNGFDGSNNMMGGNNSLAQMEMLGNQQMQMMNNQTTNMSMLGGGTFINSSIPPPNINSNTNNNARSDYMTLRPPPGQGPTPAQLMQQQMMQQNVSNSMNDAMMGNMSGMNTQFPGFNMMMNNGMGNSNTPFVEFDTGEGVVVMLYNLSTRTTCEHLFNICCLYGNVARIKFLKSREGCAMIQMGSKDAAEYIMKFLNDVQLFGTQVQVCKSKQPEIQDVPNPLNLENGTPLSKNYIGNNNNRFRNAEMASKCKILPPSRTLHFYNAPNGVTLEEMADFVEKLGAKRPVKYTFFPPKMGQKTCLGLLEWDTLGDALDALALTNAAEFVTQAGRIFHLKLAFSPKPIKESVHTINSITGPTTAINAASTDTTEAAVKTETNAKSEATH